MSPRRILLRSVTSPRDRAATSARRVPRPGRFGRSLAQPTLGIDQRAQIVEAVGGHHARSHQLPQCGFDFGLQLAGAAHDVGKERRPATSQEFQHACALIAEHALDSSAPPRPSRGCIQSDSSRTKKVMGATLVGTTRRRPSPESSSVAGCGDSRPQPDGAGQTKLIERRRDRTRSCARARICLSQALAGISKPCN